MNTEIDRKIAVILVADVIGYSKHMEKDENATLKAYACLLYTSPSRRDISGSRMPSSA